MRIIAGKYRRRLLLTNEGNTTRPITDRAKVMLFDWLEQFLGGTRVLDLYSGTGSLGLEALSRGAETVVCIEGDQRALELLKANVESIGATDHVLCWKTNGLYSSYKPLGKEGWFPFDIVFFDPPYRMLEQFKPDSPIAASLERLSSPEVTSVHARMIVRCSKFAEYELPACWKLERKILIGSMEIRVFQKQMDLPNSVESVVSEKIPEILL